MRAPPVAFALLALGMAAHADDAEFTPVVLDVRLNAQAGTSTLVLQRDTSGELWIGAADLEGLRLQPPGSHLREIEGAPYYRLNAFAGARIALDETTQSAEVMLSPDAFKPTRVGHPDAADMPLTPARPGGFLNYDLTFASDSAGSASGAQFELGFFDPKGVATSTFAATASGAEREVTRLETVVTRDFPDRLARLRIGDSISGAGAWGQSVRYAGIQFGTSFATQPTLVTTPLLGTEGVATVPATVDVFVNGQRLASEQVPPGPFAIDRLPAINGAGEMQVVVTDVLGRQQLLTQPYYSGPALLRDGLDEFSFDLGSVREDFAVSSNRYADFIAAATWRRGLSNDLTGEAHLEAQANGTTASGVDVARRVGTLGILSATFAGSHGDQGTGWLTGTGFEHSGPRFSVFARMRLTSDNFALIGQDARILRPKLRAFVGGGLRLGAAGGVNVALATQSYWNAERVDTISATWSVSVRDVGYLNLSAAHSIASGASSTDLLLLFTVPLGREHTASASLEHAPGAARGSLEATATLQKSRPYGSGYGYYSMVSTSGDYTLNYGLHGAAGQVSAEVARRNDAEGWRVQGQGGLAFTDVGLMPARRLDQSFAVVEVADYAGLTVFLENHPIGRTDESGRLLVDRLRAYEPNRISLDPTEVPMDAALTARALDVKPAWRSGPVVRFPIERAHAVTLRLRREDGTAVPAGAAVSFGTRSYAVAFDGLVYLEGVTGTAAGRARWSGRGCTFEVSRPATDEPVPDLGAIMCRSDSSATDVP